jgi:hypothetical protein
MSLLQNPMDHFKLDVELATLKKEFACVRRRILHAALRALGVHDFRRFEPNKPGYGSSCSASEEPAQ